MHACWVLLRASGVIPARILNVCPPRFLIMDRPIVIEVDTTARKLAEGPGMSATLVKEVSHSLLSDMNSA
jgi:hypothetical protein